MVGVEVDWGDGRGRRLDLELVRSWQTSVKRMKQRVQTFTFL